MSAGRVFKAMGRGAMRRCPECDRGHLFKGYLKVRPVCEACGHDNGQYPADDAPPYFTILIVGHLVIAPMLCFPVIWKAPAGLVLAVALPALALVTLAVLPLVKGAVIGAQWAIRKGEAEQDAARPHPGPAPIAPPRPDAAPVA